MSDAVVAHVPHCAACHGSGEQSLERLPPVVRGPRPRRPPQPPALRPPPPPPHDSRCHLLPRRPPPSHVSPVLRPPPRHASPQARPARGVGRAGHGRHPRPRVPRHRDAPLLLPARPVRRDDLTQAAAAEPLLRLPVVDVQRHVVVRRVRRGVRGRRGRGIRSTTQRAAARLPRQHGDARAPFPHRPRSPAIAIAQVDPTSYTPPLITVPQDPSQPLLGYWCTSVTGIKVGDTVQPGTQNVIGVIDTGTSLIAGPPAVVNPIIAQINATVDCANLATLPTLTITMALGAGATHDFVLTPAQYTVRTPGDGGPDTDTCACGLFAFDAGEDGRGEGGGGWGSPVRAACTMLRRGSAIIALSFPQPQRRRAHRTTPRSLTRRPRRRGPPPAVDSWRSLPTELYDRLQPRREQPSVRGVEGASGGRGCVDLRTAGSLPRLLI